MAVTTEDYDERIALEPWDYGGPEHVNHVEHVAIIDRDGRLVDIEDGLPEPLALGRSWPTIAVAAGSPLRALLVRTTPEPPGIGIGVRALGCMELEHNEACSRWLGQRPGRLLKFLICRRYRVVHAQDIAEALWGYNGFVSSGTVRQCVHELRDKLESGRSDAPSGLIVTRQCGYALDRSATVDADDFAVHVRRGIAALGRGQSEIATVHLRTAVAMYRGDFMSDEPEAVWARPEREHLREHMEDALAGLAELYLVAGDAKAATSCLRRLADMRPFDAAVHRRLLTVLLSQGRHTHASRCYHAFCARLEDEFERLPGFTLAEL
jgi:DNA-binding SARP family transcriptional activator